MNYNIRKASVDDAKELNYLLTLIIKDEKQYDENINDSFVITNYYEDLLQSDACISFVAEINNKIIGYLYGYIKNDGDTCIELTSKLDALYIKEEYRGQGIAKSLINEFKNWSRSKNVKYIEVQVLNDNTSAKALYAKQNFLPFKTTLITKLD